MKKQLLVSLLGLSAACVQAATYHPVDTAFVEQAAKLNITQENWDSGAAAKLTLRNAYRFTPYMALTKNDSFTHDLGKAKGLDLKKLHSRDLDGEYNLEVILRDRMNAESMVITRNGELVDEYFWNGNNQYPELQSVLDFGQLVDVEDEKEGTVYNYQCINTEMLGLVVERVAGKPLSEVIEEKLWKRVGFEHNAKWQSSRKGEIAASGGLNATTRDVNRMMHVLVNGGKNARGEQIIPEKFIKNLMAGNAEVRNAWKQGSEYFFHG